MAVTLKIPTGLTFSDIREGTPQSSIDALNTYLTSISKPTVAVGDDNPLILKLNDFDMGGAAFIRGSSMDADALCGPIENFSYIPIDYVSLIVYVGGDLEGMPMWFKLDDKTQLTPVGLPESTVNPDGSGGQVTWEDWGGPYHTISEFGGKFYRSTNVGLSGEPMKASEWLTYLVSPIPGVSIITRDQYLIDAS